jgi:hypothetical protein
MFNGCSGSIQIQYESNMINMYHGSKMVEVSLSAVKHLHLLEPLCVEGTAAERLRYHNATVGGWTTCNMVQHLAILYNSI